MSDRPRLSAGSVTTLVTKERLAASRSGTEREVIGSSGAHSPFLRPSSPGYRPDSRGERTHHCRTVQGDGRDPIVSDLERADSRTNYARREVPAKQGDSCIAKQES